MQPKNRRSFLSAFNHSLKSIHYFFLIILIRKLQKKLIKDLKDNISLKRYIINKKDILIFDLDDTIYKEIDFVNEGLKGVSYLEKILNLKKKKIFIEIKKILLKKGRGKIFDIYCKRNKIYSKQVVEKLIKIYRYCNKKIRVPKNNLRIFKKLRKNFRLYIITDGKWRVQSRKIKLLKIEKNFSKIYTDFYGKDFETFFKMF